jgi:hypothetical protein
MKVDLTKSNAIVLHLEKATDRKQYVDTLKETHPKLFIWKARDLELLDEETKNKYLDLKFFHRFPNKNSPQRRILCNCINTLQLLEILEYIVANKIDDVIVFEDDAKLFNRLTEIDVDDDDYYHYLGGLEFKVGYIVGAHAMYYPSYKKVEEMLVVLRNPKKLRGFDYMLSKYIKPVFKNKFNNLYFQAGYSISDKTYNQEDRLRTIKIKPSKPS